MIGQPITSGRGDPLQPVLDKAPRAAAMKAHAGEEAGHHEEGRHPEDMDGEGQQAEEQAWMGVPDEPELGRAGQK
jgi:hypothetical protein